MTSSLRNYNIVNIYKTQTGKLDNKELIYRNITTVNYLIYHQPTKLQTNCLVYLTPVPSIPQISGLTGWVGMEKFSNLAQLSRNLRTNFSSSLSSLCLRTHFLFTLGVSPTTEGVSSPFRFLLLFLQLSKIIFLCLVYRF